MSKTGHVGVPFFYTFGRSHNLGIVRPVVRFRSEVNVSIIPLCTRTGSLLEIDFSVRVVLPLSAEVFVNFYSSLSSVFILSM